MEEEEVGEGGGGRCLSVCGWMEKRRKMLDKEEEEAKEAV